MPAVLPTLRRWVWVVAAVVVVLSVVRAFAPMTYPGDIWRQSDTAAVARNFAENGMALFFPQIDWGGAGPGYVEMEFPLLSWLTAATYLVFGEHVVLGRLISLGFMLVGAAAFWGLARRLLPGAAARWALVAFLVSPAFMRWGTAFMPEATVLACYLLALLFFCRWLQENRAWQLVVAAAATSLAGLAKPTALHTGLVLAVWVAVAARDRWRRPSLWGAGVAALVAPVAWLVHAASLHAEYGNTFGVISGGDSKWGSVDLWLSPQFWWGSLRSEALFVYGVVGIPMAVLGVVVLWRGTDRRVLPLLGAGAVALGVYYLASGRYSGSDLGIQYHVYSLPYAALAVGAGAAWLVARGGRWSALVGTGLVLGLAAQSVNVFVQSLPDRSGILGECARGLDAVSAPDDLVVVATTSRTVQDGVANNYQEPVVFFLADRKGWSLPADRQDPGFVEPMLAEGAHYLVAGSGGPTSPELARWLADRATPVRTAVQGCEIWHLPGAGT